KSLSKNLAIYQGQLGSQLIYVTYSANNPTEAAQVANTVAEVYLTSSSIRSLKSQLVGQEANLAKLNITFGPKHPDVLQLQAQIDATRGSLTALLNSHTTNALAKMSVATQRKGLPTEYKFTSGGHYTNVSFINRATPPVKASKPKILTGLALGGIAAVILGLGIPLGYELFNRRVRCRDDLERHHGIPVLVEFGARHMRTVL
ncbi:MAG: hypothetical protein ACYDBW_09360, partial [Sulfuricaulis sp.]